MMNNNINNKAQNNNMINNIFSNNNMNNNLQINNMNNNIQNNNINNILQNDMNNFVSNINMMNNMALNSNNNFICNMNLNQLNMNYMNNLENNQMINRNYNSNINNINNFNINLNNNNNINNNISNNNNNNNFNNNINRNNYNNNRIQNFRNNDYNDNNNPQNIMNKNYNNSPENFINNNCNNFSRMNFKNINLQNYSENNYNNAIQININNSNNNFKAQSVLFNNNNDNSINNKQNLENYMKINPLLSLKEHPLTKYNFFKISFNICHYMFKVSDQFSNLFSSFYSKIINSSLIFFSKDFQQTKELLNSCENEIGIKDNWIIISPCVELEKNIQEFNDNKNVYFIIGYCYISNHEHNFEHLYKFQKFYKIDNSFDEILETLFKLNNIYYYRKKQNYDLENDENNIIELRYTTKFLFEYNNDCSKNNVIDEKFLELYNFKLKDSECYFGIILLLNLLNESLENHDLILLLNLIGNLPNLVILSNNILEKNILCGLFLKNLFTLYLYFSNYPYIYGILSDEKINEILSIFKSDISEETSEAIMYACLNVLIFESDELASKVEKGMNILNENEKENLAKLQYNLIKFMYAFDHLLNSINIAELSKFY